MASTYQIPLPQLLELTSEEIGLLIWDPAEASIKSVPQVEYSFLRAGLRCENLLYGTKVDVSPNLLEHFMLVV